MATDARGDVALVWRDDRQVGRPPHWRYDSSVGVAFAGPAGPILSRTIWRRPHSLIASVTVALDSHGELTVAWIEEHSQTPGPITVRAARRSPAGRWSVTQTVGRSSTAFFYADPELAVAPDREVLLTWNAGSSVGLKEAWRTPNHGFGGATAVSHSQRAAILGPTPVIDPGGAAHIYGTVACGSRKSRGVMLSTAPHSHRFLAPVLVAPAPAENLVVSFSARGQALAAWQRGECSTLEPGPGRPYARSMLNGTFTAPVVLDPAISISSVIPVAARGGGGSVAWVGQSLGPMPTETTSLLMTTADANGHFSQPATAAAGLVPVARDGGGDIVLQDRLEQGAGGPIVPSGSTAASPVAVQPATGGALELSPLRPALGTPLALSLSNFTTAVPTVGRGAALVWRDGKTGAVAISTWRP